MGVKGRKNKKKTQKKKVRARKPKGKKAKTYSEKNDGGTFGGEVGGRQRK